MDAWGYPLLFGVAGVAGWVDSIAGGGGLLTVPALLWTGLPVPVVLGTNKLQASCGTAIATWRYAQAGLLRRPALGLGMAATLCGAIVGVAWVHQVQPDLLRRSLPAVLVLVALYFGCQPWMPRLSPTARVAPGIFALVGGVLLGFYDGAFGPGTGSFWMAACVGLRGMDLREATGWTKAMNLTSNLASLAVFLGLGHVDFRVGLVMAGGQVLGARLGSGMVLRHGQGLIRPVLLVVVLGLAAKLAMDAGW